MVHDISSYEFYRLILTQKKSLAKTLPGVIDAFEDLKSAQSEKTIVSAFRQFKGAFKNAKRSILSEQSSLQTTRASVEVSRFEQGNFSVVVHNFYFLPLEQ